MGSLPRLLIFCAISLCSFARGNEPYPIVDKSAQAARDIERRAILETELASELSQLRTAQEALAKAPSDEMRRVVHRREENVKALRRELERVTAPIRVNARAASANATTVNRPALKAVDAPFWDVYRRTAPPTDFQPPAKESP